MLGTIFITHKGLAIDVTHVCSCVNISPRGIGIDCPEPLPIDVFLQVGSEEQAPPRMARVRYCQQRGAVYRVGLQFVTEPQ